MTHSLLPAPLNLMTISSDISRGLVLSTVRIFISAWARKNTEIVKFLLLLRIHTQYLFVVEMFRFYKLFNLQNCETKMDAAHTRLSLYIQL